MKFDLAINLPCPTQSLRPSGVYYEPFNGYLSWQLLLLLTLPYPAYMPTCFLLLATWWFRILFLANIFKGSSLPSLARSPLFKQPSASSQNQHRHAWAAGLVLKSCVPMHFFVGFDNTPPTFERVHRVLPIDVLVCTDTAQTPASDFGLAPEPISISNHSTFPLPDAAAFTIRTFHLVFGVAVKQTGFGPIAANRNNPAPA